MDMRTFLILASTGLVGCITDPAQQISQYRTYPSIKLCQIVMRDNSNLLMAAEEEAAVSVLSERTEDCSQFESDLSVEVKNR